MHVHAAGNRLSPYLELQQNLKASLTVLLVDHVLIEADRLLACITEPR